MSANRTLGIYLYHHFELPRREPKAISSEMIYIMISIEWEEKKLSGHMYFSAPIQSHVPRTWNLKYLKTGLSVIFGFLTPKKLTHTKLQDERMTRAVVIRENGRFYPRTPISVNVSNLNNFGVEGWNFQGLIISTLSTNSEKMNKIWEVRVSTSKIIGWFAAELPDTKKYLSFSKMFLTGWARFW